MRPLSTYKHYISNKKKFLFLFVPVLLSIILIYTLQMLITSEFRVVSRTYIEPQKHYFSIAAKTKVIDNDTIKSILTREMDYERVLPWVAHYTFIDSFIEKNIGSKVITVKYDDMVWLITKMNLKIIDGRLPVAGTNEIILHKTVADCKNLKIGDKIGSNVQKNESIEGEKVIVGLLEGESIVSFDSLEYWMDINHVEYDDYSTGIILVPIKSEMNNINTLFNTIDSQGLDIRTYDKVYLQNSTDKIRINIIVTVFDLMVLITITICLGFISYINIIQRRSEFGILSAMGYSSQELIKRLFYEIIWVNLLALVSGILISITLGVISNIFIFMPKGLSLLLIKPLYMIQATCIPLFVCIFELVPAWNSIKKLDTVAVIEGMV